ncbi:MAG: NAD-dependent succinate-semialdehyde dehydrogenase [Desulfovibrionaceae bacterium]|nr:NAD-dependent succinate-semialdehyde dehydrogenase [Desulfovibrionaceae bacterium]
MKQLNDPTLFRMKNYINGQWIDADSGKTIAVENPATLEPLGTVPDCGSAEMQRAIDAASAAWHAWRAKTSAERCACLLEWYRLIKENTPDLARILTLEQGKPLAESLGEITQNSGYIPWFAEEARRLCGETVPTPRHGVRPITHWQPVGVVFAITPWNFPIGMIPRKAAPALAAGCTFIARPSSATPFSALALAALAEKAGIPAGVFNVITGQTQPIVDTMAADKRVRKVTFTGSTAVGKSLMAACAGTVKRVSLELGGNAPFIIFDDADPDKAAALCVASKFRNAGQTCICTNRVLVQQGIKDAFMRAFTEKVKALVVGSGLEAKTTVGPLISETALNNVASIVRDALDKGAKLLTGGHPHALGGRFFEPTVLDNATTEMRAFTEEIFGPVAPVFTFESEKEALELANRTNYGLAAYVCTQNAGRIFRMIEGLEYGMVGVNDVSLAAPETPFGGVKESGVGREGGHESLKDFMDARLAVLGDIEG